MKRIIGFTLLALTPLAQAIEYREELAPPNVDFYLELHGTRTDFGNLGGGERDGMRIRIGVDMKDATVGRWMLRGEVALNQFGETSDTSRTTEDLQVGELFYPGTITTETTSDLRLGGIEAGLRLYDSELFFVRGGVFLYSLKRGTDVTETINPDAGGTIINNLVPDQESFSGIGPYLGAGFEFPLVESLKAVAEFNTYRVESENLNNLSLGFRFEF
jgi:hypothetical protein